MKTACCDSEKGLMLHAYELNILSEEEKDTFEAHLLECEYCIQQLKEFAPYGSLLSTSPKIKSILQTTDLVKETFIERLRQYLWSDKAPIIFRPALLIFILLILSYPAYLGLFHNGNNNITSLQEISLMQTRTEQTPIFEVNRHSDIVISFIIPNTIHGQSCSVKLEDSDGRIIYENNEFSLIDNFGVGRILLPYQYLSQKNYKLSIQLITSKKTESSIIEFNFKVRY